MQRVLLSVSLIFNVSFLDGRAVLNIQHSIGISLNVSTGAINLFAVGKTTLAGVGAFMKLTEI